MLLLRRPCYCSYSKERSMLVSSTDVPPDSLGSRSEGERRKGERRRQPRLGADRRQGERRRAAVRNVVLATAAVILPQHVKPQSLDSTLSRPPAPVVTTTAESGAPVPPQHADDQVIRGASLPDGVRAAL